MSIAVCILAKDERTTLGQSLAQLAKQTFIANESEGVDVHVVANGCTDDTVEIARRCRGLFEGSHANLHVHDLQPGGKSRAWNRAVHELVSANVKYFVFIDADITLANNAVIAEMLACLKSNPRLVACTGFPVKDVILKPKKNIIDRFSLVVSDRTRSVGAINGSLYVARAHGLRETWLPDQTPGEDGFLNAMLTTAGFTRAADLRMIAAPSKPTHSFHAHGPLEFVSHERRMIVGTMINCWIFEHLWSLKLQSSAGPWIRDWNKTDPGWVDRLVGQRTQKQSWLISNEILFGRFKGIAAVKSWWKKAVYLIIAAAATLLTLPPAFLANKRLKERGASATW